MNSLVVTYEVHNIGDQMVFLHLARALAKQNPNREFVHFTNGCNIPQLVEVVQDLPQIKVLPFEDKEWQFHKEEAVNVWKNYDRFWEASHDRWRWAEFMLNYHHWTSTRLGLGPSPFSHPAHLLFDYPALKKSCEGFPIDFLVCDARPCSGQFMEAADHSKDTLSQFVALLRTNDFKVVTTEECRKEGMTITQIGSISHDCRHHVCMASGPFWTTLTTTNNHFKEGRKRIALLSNGEKLNMPAIQQVESIAELFEVAGKENWI